MRWQKQRLVNWLQCQAELKAIREVLIPRYAEIEMIILFGSYAKGKWVEDVYTEKGTTYEYKSDYDLLIILSKNEHANSYRGKSRRLLTLS
jgi:predicted nucleotidyltransferase